MSCLFLPPMDAHEATHILNISGVVGAHLHEDFNDFQTKLLQTDHDIQRLKGVYRKLKEIRATTGFEDDGPELEVILTTSEALISLGKTIAKLETKREGLNLWIYTVNSAATSANKFANKIPGIPKLN